MSNHVISGLVRRRRELTADMADLLAKADAIADDVAALDKTLRLFEPGIDLESIAALKRRPKPDWAASGEVVRLVLSILRIAEAPMTVREIAAEINRRSGHAGELTQRQLKQVRKCLDRQRARGLVLSSGEDGL